MPIEFRDLQRDSQLAQQERDEQFKRRTALIPVVLTDVEGSTADGNGDPVNAQVIGKINYVWARAYNEGIPAQYLNVRGVLPIGGTPCWAGYDEASTEREILRVNELDPSTTLQQPQNDHHRDHEPGGYQLVNVYLRAIVPLKLSPKSGLTVTVAPFTYPKTDGTFEVFPGNNSYDLSGSLPGAGLARYTLVYLDPSTNTLAVTDGATTIDTGSIVPDFPDPIAGTYPSAWVRLANGQTTINEVQDIEDARMLFLPFSPSVLGGNVWPKAGKIMWNGTEYVSINAACAAATSGEVLLGPGTAYAWDVSTNLTAGVSLRGPGRFICTITVSGTTTIDLDAATISGVKITRTVDSATDVYSIDMATNSSVEDMESYCENTDGTLVGTATAIRVNGTNCDIVNSVVTHTDTSGNGDGLYISGAYTVRVYAGRVSNIADSGSSTLVLYGTPNVGSGGISVNSLTGIWQKSSLSGALQNYNINQYTEETSPAVGDWFLMERASDGDVRKVSYSNVKTPNPNLLINGAADIWQVGTSFDSTTTPLNSDDTYLEDNWLLVSDGNDIVDVSQQTSSPPSGARYFSRHTVQTANKQFGRVLFLEASDAIPLRGQTVSLSLQAKTTAAAIDNIRAGILEWTGTADSITSDVVGTWAGAGTNPTLAASWAYANTPANLALTTSWQNFGGDASITAVTLGNTLNNLAVFVWVDDTTISINDILDLATIKLERGSVATAYEPVGPIRIEAELSACQRYIFPISDASALRVFENGTQTSAATIDWQFFIPSMFAVPSLSHTATGYGTGATQIRAYNYNLATNSTASALSFIFQNGTNQMAVLRLQNITNGSSPDICQLVLGADVKAWLSAQL